MKERASSDRTYRLLTDGFAIQGGEDFHMKDWPQADTIIFWFGEVKPHAHAVLYDYPKGGDDMKKKPKKKPKKPPKPSTGSYMK